MKNLPTPEIIKIYQQIEKYDTELCSLSDKIYEYLNKQNLCIHSYHELMSASSMLEDLKNSVLAEIGRIVIENHPNETEQ